MNRRELLKLSLLSGSAVLLSGNSDHVEADSFPTGGNFPPSPKTRCFVQELPRMPVKAPLPGEVKDLSLKENGGVAPNGTVYPQITGNDALTTYSHSPERIVALQQRNSGNNIQFPPKLFYVLNVRQARHVFHPDAPYDKGSIIWGYDGIFPGPTFLSRYGVPILVRIINGLFDDTAANPQKIAVQEDPGTPFGDARITTHLHNGHSGSESDGNPFDIYPPSDPNSQYPASIRAIRFRDHHYAMFRAGLDPSRPANMPPPNVNDGDIRETVSTLWYHDHSDHFTAANVYKGLVGFHLFFDEVDSGNENDLAPGALRLPSGEFDIPLLFQDKRFNADGQLVLDSLSENHLGFLGDKFTVNGLIQPKLTVLRRKYRFRLLNGGPSRVYQFFLTKNDVDQTFKQIGNDESLLEQPEDVSSVLLAVAERADVIVDFSQFKQGDQVFLVSRLVMQDDGQGPQAEFDDDGKFIKFVILPAGKGDQILRFDVGDNAADPSQVPARLRAKPGLPSYLPDPLTPEKLKALQNHRIFVFEFGIDQVWKINGKEFDPDTIGEVLKQGPPTGSGPDGWVWTLKNEDASIWSHPIHIHLEEFQILLRNGKPPDRTEQTKKDVLLLRPNEEVQIFLRFRDFLGKYPIHCHNVIHEDMAMMMRFDVVTDGAQVLAVGPRAAYFPKVTLKTQDNKEVRFYEDLIKGKIVVMNLMYTSCDSKL
jgi:FtsP/CotA-like multicopper oxidase with cupredoxin domain